MGLLFSENYTSVQRRNHWQRSIGFEKIELPILYEKCIPGMRRALFNLNL